MSSNRVHAIHQRANRRRIISKAHSEAYWTGRRKIWNNPVNKALREEYGSTAP